MAGVGKLLKEAQKMQRKIEAVQQELAVREIEVSSGGGAVVVRVNAQSQILGLRLDPDFLKEEPKFVEETILAALQEAATKAKATYEEEMKKATGGFGLGGLMGA